MVSHLSYFKQSKNPSGLADLERGRFHKTSDYERNSDATCIHYFHKNHQYIYWETTLHRTLSRHSRGTSWLNTQTSSGSKVRTRFHLCLREIETVGYSLQQASPCQRAALNWQISLFWWLCKWTYVWWRKSGPPFWDSKIGVQFYVKVNLCGGGIGTHKIKRSSWKLSKIEICKEDREDSQSIGRICVES